MSTVPKNSLTGCAEPDESTRGSKHRETRWCSGQSVRSFAFGRKGFDNAHTAQGFFKLRHGVAPFVLGIEAFVFESTADASHHPAHEGEYDEGKGQRKLPRHVNQHAEVANQQNGVFNQHFERAGYRRFDFVHVAAHARNDVACVRLRRTKAGAIQFYGTPSCGCRAQCPFAGARMMPTAGKVASGFQEGHDNQEQADGKQC